MSNDRPDWSTSGVTTGTVQSVVVALSMKATTHSKLFRVVTVAATQQLELHRILLQYLTASTSASIEVQGSTHTGLLVWYPRTKATAFGSILQFDFEGAVLGTGASLEVTVTTNFGHGAELQTTVNYVVR